MSGKFFYAPRQRNSAESAARERRENLLFSVSDGPRQTVCKRRKSSLGGPAQGEPRVRVGKTFFQRTSPVGLSSGVRARGRRCREPDFSDGRLAYFVLI